MTPVPETNLAERSAHASHAARRPALAARVKVAAAVIRQEADAIEAAAAITQPVFDALRDAGLLSITIPESGGGEGADFRAFAETIEALCCADGSAGWVYWVLVGMRSGAWMYGSSAILAIIFDEANPQMIAGQAGRFADGVTVAGGYRVSGRYAFASGSRHADWICAGAAISENGKPLLNEDGSPRTIHFWVPKEQVRFVGNWNVMGLAATESYDYELDDCFVPEDHACDGRGVIGLLPPLEDRDLTPLLRLGGINVALGGHGAIAVGLARRALEEVVRITGRIQRPDYPTVVRDHPAFQAAFSEQEIKFQSARANYYTVYTEAERSVADGSPLSAERQARLRQATSWMHKVAEETIRFAHSWSGTGVVRNPSPMARCIRDIAVATQHIMADPIGLTAAAPAIIAAWAVEAGA